MPLADGSTVTPKPKKDDLIIGEKKWITYVQHDWRNEEWLYVDEILDPLIPLFDVLETDCVAECCGLHAFSFLPDSIVAASAALDVEQLHEWLVIVVDEVAQLTDDVLASKRLNNAIDRGTLVELLQHIQISLPGPNAT